MQDTDQPENPPSTISHWIDGSPFTPASLVIRTLVCMAPLSLLIMNLGATYLLDWHNHLWIMEYFAAYIQQHYELPVLINTQTLAGIPHTLFYGGCFYAVGGALSLFLGSSVALRVMALVTLLIQFIHLERAIREVSGHARYAFLIATLITWAIYPLTNLYSRGALPEFFAVAFLFSSVSCLLVLIHRLSTGIRSWYDAIAIGFFFLLVALTHPLTAMYGGICIALLGAAGLWHMRSLWLLYVFGANVAGGVLSLASWLYMLKSYSRQLSIHQAGYLQSDGFWIGEYGFSVFCNLFSPVPYEQWSLMTGTYIDTPYLEKQCLLPLLVLCIGFGIVWSERRADTNMGTTDDKKGSLYLLILAIGGCIFGTAAMVIVFPFLSNYAGHLFHSLQFSYRLTTYVNLGLFICSWALLGLIQKKTRETEKEEVKTAAAATAALMPVFVTIAITLSIVGLWAKILHCDVLTNLFYYDRTKTTEWKAREVPAKEWRAGVFKLGPNIDELPWTMYSQRSFAITTGTLPSADMAGKPVKTAVLPRGPQFGTVAPVQIDLPEATCVVTNLLPFPWNRLVVDGVVRDVSTLTTQPYPAARKAARQEPSTYAVDLPAGRHTLEYRLEPDPMWQRLTVLGWAATLLWAALWTVAGIAAVRRPFHPSS